MVKSKLDILFILRLGILFCIILTMLSCRNHLESIYTLGIANEGLVRSIPDIAVDDISQFLISAAEINREEIQMGQLAKFKGNNVFIKEFCIDMEGHHTIVLNELNQLARQREIYLHTQFSHYAQDSYQQLINTVPEDFDRAYCDWIIISKQEAIALYNEASNDTTDLEINAWAKSILPMLKQQLRNALACQKKIERV